MIVKCIKNKLRKVDPDVGPHDWEPDLTIGKRYQVITIETDDFRILGDDGGPCLYPAMMFDVVDPTPGEDWVKEVDEEAAVWWGPSELLEVGIWEDSFDGVESAVARVQPYLDRQHQSHG